MTAKSVESFLEFFSAIWRNVADLIHCGSRSTVLNVERGCNVKNTVRGGNIAMLNRMRKHGILVFTWAKAMTCSIHPNTKTQKPVDL